MANYVVIRSTLIATAQEARDYYAARLAGTQAVKFANGVTVNIVFEGDGTHLYSEDPGTTPIPQALQITRRVKGGRIEVRRFSIARAVAMDEILDAIRCFTVSIPGTGQNGHEKQMLHGPRRASNDYIRVVLRPGVDPKTTWVCVSAYAVNAKVWLEANRSKRAKFPP